MRLYMVLELHDECLFSEDIVCAAKDISSSELYTVINCGSQLLGSSLRGRKFIVSCNNEAALSVINSSSTRNSFMYFSLRQLWFEASVYDFELTACHIPCVHNVLADALR